MRIEPFTAAVAFLALEIFPAVVLWLFSPTDSVRVWYPTLASYVGEHTVVLVAFTLVLLIVSRNILADSADWWGWQKHEQKLMLTWRTTPRLMGLFLLADWAATAYLWRVHVDKGAVRLWYTQNILDYLLWRATIVGILLLTALLGIVISQALSDRSAD